MEDVHPGEGVIHFEDFTLDLRAGELQKDGRRIHLQEQPLQVLGLLLERPGDVVTRDELRERLWPDDTFVDFDHGLNKAINKVRDALNDSAQHPRFVETLPRRGYRFIASVAAPSLQAPDPVSAALIAPKSVLRTMGIALLATAVVAAIWYWTSGESVSDGESEARAMLVVLPFENLSNDEDQEYFSDGLTEEMISQLASLNPDRLGVIARTSSMTYKNARTRLDQIGAELGVGYALEGTVRRAGDRLRITAQLIQTSDQTQLWAESYDRRLEDVFAIQKDVAERIADSLTLELIPGGAYREPTSNSKAHEAYLRGRFFWNTRTEEGLRRGLAHFEEAVAEDGDYALAHLGIADSYILLANYGAVPPNEALPHAIEAAQRALDLKPDHTEALISRTWARWAYALDWEEASQQFPRAMRANPSHSFSYQLFASYLAALGRHQDAVAEMKRARELDPLSLVINSVLAWHYFLAREPDLAIEQCQRTLEMDPEFSRVHSYLGWAYMQKSMQAEALLELKRSRDLFGDSPARTAELAHGYAVAGQSDEALRLLGALEELAREQYVEAALIAKIYVGLGDPDGAVPWLEQSLTDRSVHRARFNIDPLLDPLREDPRFEAISKRLRFPEGS